MFENNFTRWHVRVAFALWLAFAALTLVILLRGLDHAAQRPLTVAATVAGSVLGPMSGALSRGLQPCCLAFSLSLMPFCLAALAVATAAQVVRLPEVSWVRITRLAIWAAGLILWFGGGIVSFAHALG
ncbi:MAG: hypothetical protein ACKOEM_12320 [Planctomycetia bacterium]